MATKLPWYILPLFPALALLIGAQLAELWQQGKQVGIPQFPLTPYSRLWIGALGLLGLGGWVGAAYFIGWAAPSEANLWPILATAGAALLAAALLAARQNPQFITVLAWGTFLALWLLMLSPHWAWELAEAYPVRPVAALVQQSPETKIYTSYPYNRPSAEFLQSAAGASGFGSATSTLLAQRLDAVDRSPDGDGAGRFAWSNYWRGGDMAAGER